MRVDTDVHLRRLLTVLHLTRLAIIFTHCLNDLTGWLGLDPRAAPVLFGFDLMGAVEVAKRWRDGQLTFEMAREDARLLAIVRSAHILRQVLLLLQSPFVLLTKLLLVLIQLTVGDLLLHVQFIVGFAIYVLSKVANSFQCFILFLFVLPVIL